MPLKRLRRPALLYAAALMLTGCNDSGDTSGNPVSPDQAAATTSAASSRKAKATTQHHTRTPSPERATSPAPPTPTGPVSVAFRQVGVPTFWENGVWVVRNQAEWEQTRTSLILYAIHPAAGGVPPECPCDLNVEMLVIAGLGRFNGCSMPSINVREVTLFDGAMMVHYGMSPVQLGEPIYVSGHPIYITCPASFPMNFSLCVPQFEGPVELAGFFSPTLTVVTP